MNTRTATALIACSLALIALDKCHAAEPPGVVIVGAHVATYHFDRSQNFNEFNPGAYVAYEGWTAGAYFNSERAVSAYAGYTFQKLFGSPFDLMAGAVTGYANRSVQPMLIPSVKFGFLRLSLIPLAEKQGGAIHASVEFEL